MSAEPYQVMPPLSAEEYEALRADIAERGILVAVVKDQHGNILDGHHRVNIAAEFGISYPVEVREVADEEAARDVALALNLARRHLTREQRRELIAAEVKRRPDDSDRAIARRLCCDHKTVGSVRRELSGEIPHPGLTPAQRQMADMLFQVMRSRTLEARARVRAYEAENDTRPAGSMWTLTNAAECSDMAVVSSAFRRYAEWSLTAEEVRGFLWDFADPDEDWIPA